MGCTRCPLEPGKEHATGVAPTPVELLAQLADCDDCPLASSHPCSAQEGATLVQYLREAAVLRRNDQRALKKAQNTIRELSDAAHQATDRVEKLEAVQKESMRQADSELKAKMDLVARQQAAILAMSTPTIEVMDGVLALPIIGTLDDERAGILTDSLLGEIIRVRARWAILDLTGVSALDSRTARILSTVAGAVQLLGARVMLSGIRPQVAQELVSLGQDVASLQTARTLKDALRHCGFGK